MSKNTFKTAVLLAAIGGLFMLIGQLLAGATGLTIAFAIALVFVGGQYWLCDKIAIKAAGAIPVTPEQMPEYYRIVQDLPSGPGCPCPGCT